MNQSNVKKKIELVPTQIKYKEKATNDKYVRRNGDEIVTLLRESNSLQRIAKKIALNRPVT